MFRISYILPSLLIACSGENVIEKQQNSAPTITIMSHSDGAEVQDGYVESFRAAVSDDDNEFDELQVAWYVGEELICDWETATPSGEDYCDIVFSEEDVNVIAEVRDTQGAGGRHEIEIIVHPTEAPVVELLTPLTDVNYYSDQLIQFSAIISDEEDALEDLIVTWSSSIDGELSLDTTPDSSGELSDYTFLTEGQHAIEVRVEDTSGKTDIGEVVILVGGENNIPTCEITEPADQTTVVFGDDVIFRGTAGDADIPATDLSFLWQSDKDGDLGSGSINSAGEISFPYSNLTADNHVITLVVEDEIGAVCQDTIILGVSNLPMAQIDNPLDGEVFSVGDTVSFQGTVSDQEDLAHELSVIWTSSLDGELHSGTANSSGITQFTSNALTAGLHSLTLNVEDSFGLIDDDVISFRVNTPPTVDSAGLSPDPIYSNDSLAVSASFSDADGDTVTGSYQWYEDGTLTSHTGTSINSSELDVGETWTVRVTPNDGYVDGSYLEQTITVSNTDPTITQAGISSSDSPSTYIDSILTCSATASDIDETVTVSYSWDVNGASYTGATLDLSTISASPNDVIECIASVTDSFGGTASSTASLSIDNRAPSVSSVTITPNTGVLTNTELICSGVVSDPDESNLTPSYEWFIGGTSAGNSTALQLDNSLVSPTDTVECVVTVIDAQGTAASASSTVTVDNSDPIIDSISLSPSLLTPLDTLTCSATASDVDGDTPTLSFSFANLTSSSVYTPTSTSSADATLDLSTITIFPGDEIECTVTATDSNSGQASASTSLLIDWSAPSISVSAQGSSHTGDTVTCLGIATDHQGNDISSSIQFHWINASNSGTILSSQATYTIDANDTNVGDSLECTGSITDQFSFTNSATATLSVDNTAPSFLSSPEISDYSPEQGDTISCSYTGEDIDLDSIQVTYEWWNVTNNALMATGQSYIVDDPQGSAPAQVGDELNCVVILSDGTDTIQESSPNATVENGLPVISNLAITPNTGVVTGTLLTCSATVTDPTDGNLTGTSAVTYEWTVNGGTVVSTQDTYTVDASETDVGDSIACNIVATDSDGGTAADSTSVTIDNSLPTFSNSQLSPIPAYNDSVLTCSTTLEDIDEPAASLTPIYIWLQNGSVIDPSLTSDTIDLSLYPIQTTDTISCALNYTDANQGAAADTVSTTIDNRPPPTPTIQITPTSPVEGIDDIVCEISGPPFDDDGDMITYIFSWMKNGAPYQGTTSFTNHLNDTIPASETTASDLWECTVTPNDGIENGTPIAATITVSPVSTGSGSWTDSAAAPIASAYHSAIFDSTNARALMFGGQSYYQLNSELYEYDTVGQAWAVRGTAGVSLPPLSQMSSAYDSATAQWFIFGGESYYSLSEELYVLDTTLNAETWDSWPAASNGPEARRGGVSIVDEVNGLFYVIGGQGYYALLSDIWVMDIGNSSNAGATWTEIVGSGTAPTRTNSAAVFDATNDAIYLFGGQEYYKLSDTTACFDTLTETWSYPSFTGDTIPPMHSATAIWSDTIGGFVISGGQSYYQLLDSVYTLIPDGVCSGEVTAITINSGSVLPHMGASLVQDNINQESILIGGQTYYQLMDSVSHFTP